MYVPVGADKMNNINNDKIYTSKHIINMNFVHYTLESLMLTVYYHILLSNENNVQHPAILNDSLLCQHTK